MSWLATTPNAVDILFCSSCKSHESCMWINWFTMLSSPSTSTLAYTAERKSAVMTSPCKCLANSLFASFRVSTSPLKPSVRNIIARHIACKPAKKNDGFLFLVQYSVLFLFLAFFAYFLLQRAAGPACSKSVSVSFAYKPKTFHCNQYWVPNLKQSSSFSTVPAKHYNFLRLKRIRQIAARLP